MRFCHPFPWHSRQLAFRREGKPSPRLFEHRLRPRSAAIPAGPRPGSAVAIRRRDCRHERQPHCRAIRLEREHKIIRGAGVRVTNERSWRATPIVQSLGGQMYTRWDGCSSGWLHVAGSFRSRKTGPREATLDRKWGRTSLGVPRSAILQRSESTSEGPCCMSPLDERVSNSARTRSPPLPSSHEGGKPPRWW